MLLNRNEEVYTAVYWFSLPGCDFPLHVFTFIKLISNRAYKSFHRKCSLTPIIKASEATSSINPSNLSISSLNLFKYTRGLPFYLSNTKKFSKALLDGYVGAKHDTSFI